MTPAPLTAGELLAILAVLIPARQGASVDPTTASPAPRPTREDRPVINPDERLTILANKNVSRGKMAAAAVHAALMHYGIPHGAVIVLGELTHHAAAKRKSAKRRPL